MEKEKIIFEIPLKGLNIAKKETVKIPIKELRIGKKYE